MIKLVLIFTLFSAAFPVVLKSHEIEHQIRLCDDEFQIVKKLKIDHPATMQPTEKNYSVYLLDTINKNYTSSDWTLRLKSGPKNVELTVKKKIPSGEKLDSLYKNMVCEYDLHGDIKNFSCKIDSFVSKEQLQEVMDGGDWQNLLDGEQFRFLKEHGEVFHDVKLWGILRHRRLQWKDASFEKVTLDFIKSPVVANNAFFEISIRYRPKDEDTLGKQFEEYLKQSEIKLCSNQAEWLVKKIDTLKTLN